MGGGSSLEFVGQHSELKYFNVVSEVAINRLFREVALFNCPLSAERASRLIEQLDLESNDRVLDIGCGEGEFLIRVAEQYDITGIGVDRNLDLITGVDKKQKTKG